jgi:hypothetical protein
MTDQIENPNEPDEKLRRRLHEIRPPQELEARVTKSLQEAGLVGGSVVKSTPWQRRAFAIAAALLLFIGGMGARSAWELLQNRGGEPAQRFALLLYEGDSQALVEDDVAAHRTWARKLAESGHEISGEKLNSYKLELSPTIAQPGSVPVPDLQGFFIISAASEAEAAAIARSSPHFQHGGLVVVRKIDPT